MIATSVDYLAASVFDLQPIEGHDVRIMFLRSLIRFLDTIRDNRIITIDIHYVVSSGLPRNPIPDGALTRILLIDCAQAAIPGSECIDYFPRSVGRSIIDDDDFKVTVSLMDHGLQALFDPRLDVIAGDAYRYGHHLVESSFTRLHPAACVAPRTAAPVSRNQR